MDGEPHDSATAEALLDADGLVDSGVETAELTVVGGYTRWPFAQL